MGAACGCCEVEGSYALNALRNELAGTKLRVRREPEVWVTIEHLEVKEGGNVTFSPAAFNLKELTIRNNVEVLGTRAELAALAAERGAAKALQKLNAVTGGVVDEGKSSSWSAKAKNMVQSAGDMMGQNSGTDKRNQTVEVTIDMTKTFGVEEVQVQVKDIKTEHALINKLFSVDLCKAFIEQAVSKKVGEVVTRVQNKQTQRVAEKLGVSSQPS